VTICDIFLITWYVDVSVVDRQVVDDIGDGQRVAAGVWRRSLVAFSTEHLQLDSGIF